MNYKVLIKNLRQEASFQNGRFGRGILASELENAASAIENLLKELEAAIKLIPHSCQTCKWRDSKSSRIGSCNAPDGFEACYSGNGNAWEWRGAEQAPACCCSIEHYSLAPEQPEA